jgi:hypothetical protein
MIWQPLALEAGPSYLTGTARRGWLLERSLQPKTGDEGDRLSQTSAAVEKLQGGISAIGEGHDLALRVPAPYQQEQLPSPLLGYLLVASAPLGSITLGRSQS